LAIRAYNSPGVNITETINPALAPLLGNPSLVALVGPAASQPIATERVYLSGTTPVTLRHTGVVTNTLVVLDNVTGAVINPGNYTVAQGTDPDTTRAGDEPYTIVRFPGPTGSAATPTLTIGTGTLTGTFVYAYSYVNAAGETGLSPTSSPITLTAQGASLANVTVGPTGTTARNIYRAPVTGGVTGQFTLVATIANNTATTLTNETAAATTTLPKTGIEDGATVVVTYNYQDSTYYLPTLLSDYDDIVEKYGAPYDAAGAILSPLTLAARFAFQNGASELVLLASATSADADISSALSKLDDDAIQLVGVVTGGTSALTSLSAHISSMGALGKFRRGVVGRDTTVTPLTAQQMRDSQIYNNEGLIHVAPGAFLYVNPVTGKEITIGGQYAAAAVLGMLAARDPQIPLTRKTLAGFSGVYDVRTETEKSLASAAGLLVIEEKNGVIRIRHGVTTAAGNVNTREISVVGAKYEMGHRLRSTLDGIVGIVAPVAEGPVIVRSLVAGVLEQLVVEQIIDSYRNVKARLLPSDLTTVEVKFEYTPAYPINNIQIVFTINTQTGDFATNLGT
jgi:hypothetical protein